MGLLSTAQTIRDGSTPLWRALVFWGGLFLVILQAERLFLLPEVVAANVPSLGVVTQAFVIGIGNDLLVALGGIVTGLLVTALSAGACLLLRPSRTLRGFLDAVRRLAPVIFLVIAVMLVCLTTADACYYLYNHQHLDFVFFEFLDELFHGVSAGTSSQAAAQTGAELDDAWKWIRRIGGLWALSALFMVAWRVLHSRLWHVERGPWQLTGVAAGLVLVFGTMTGAAAGWGHWTGPFAQTLHIEQEAYYSLSQNPLLFAMNPLRDALLSQWTWRPATLPEPMTVAEAIQVSQAALANGEAYPSSDYPLVRTQHEAELPYFGRRVNVLLLFAEGLDRRYLDRQQSVGGASIRVTPFLDQLKKDSLYFAHFFSNGVQTTRGLFSTLCSALPRQGTAAIKTRYQHDYLCLPSVLRAAGYQTEMVVSLDGDMPGLQEFLNKNGIHRYYGEHDFPADAERLGVGLTDGALFDFIGTRLEALQSEDRPYFLTTLTAGTHHPFTVPTEHPEVRALQQDSDGYFAALRYFDAAFERFFTRAQSKGWLKNTLVIMLGDHGRHEPIGETDADRQAGHFLAPLYLWVDPSLRTEDNYRARVVGEVTSQIDIAPTVMAINGLTLPLSPFVGRSAVCLLTRDCLETNRAYLSSVYDDLIGLADASGLWLYSFRRNQLSAVDLDLQQPARHPTAQDPTAREHLRHMTALYLASNTLLERNRLWSIPNPGRE